jgi:IS605 OrfB family transposase
MSQRAFTARLIVSHQERAALWQTHRVFNERLRWVVRQVQRMKRGDPDPRYAEIFKSIKGAQGASAALEAVTSLDWKPGEEKGKTGWRKLARELISEGKLLFDRQRELAGLVHHKFHRRLFEAAFQMIHGHQELVKIWKKEHDKWKKAREKWEHDNPEYMRLRPVLEAFEAEHGQAAKRRLRWHKWLAFLGSRPDLAAWRGGAAVVHELDEAAKRRVQESPPKKRNRLEADEFFKKNPELKELDAKHGYYQREYVRPWAKKTPNPDGFRHRPTFTEPSAEKHPFWFQFMRDQGYKDLDLKACSLGLWLLGCDASKPVWECRGLKFRSDRRLRLLRKAPEPVKIGKSTFTYVFDDAALGVAGRPAEIRGAKLIFKPARPDGNIYLYFTLDVPDLDCRLSIKQESCDKYGAKWVCDKIRKELDGANPITCAVDLGIRRLAAATVRREGKIVRARIIREDDRPGGGPRLPAIGGHKRMLAAKRRERGKPVRGQKSCVRLQKHVTDMGEDRFKKGARRIVNFAYENGCHLIILEKLKGLIPDAEKERGINRALINWNRGHLAKWIKQLAGDAGIRVVEVDPKWTSQLCSKCGAFGARFSAEHGLAVFDDVNGKKGGSLFACPECSYTANADHNASVNLHRKFYGELASVKWLRTGVYRVTAPEKPPVKVSIEQVKNRLAARVARMCRKDATF